MYSPKQGPFQSKAHWQLDKMWNHETKTSTQGIVDCNPGHFTDPGQVAQAKEGTSEWGGADCEMEGSAVETVDWRKS